MIRAVLNKSFAALLVLSAMALTPATATAASKSGAEARTISTGVFELLVGGSWEQKKKSGYYRAVALAAGKSGKEYAEVWLQWISVGKKNATVLKNIPIKEVSKLNLPSLTLAMDVEETGAIVLVVTHYNEETGDPITHEFHATAPGTYSPLEAQVAADQTAEPAETETK